jgi:ubiquinone/menaquinone biosynthesis C-methylase UbiE
MAKDHEWENESFWIEVERKGLYPPERITKIQGAEALIRGEDFRNKKVLDNGCGTGWFAGLLGGADVIGTDISETLLQEAAKSIPTRKASSYDLPFEDSSFDYVISFMVLHVLDEPLRAIDEAYRVLRPGGRYYVGMVNPDSEVWDEKTGLCSPSSGTRTEERTWVFNLTDGRSFTKHYINRPREFYVRAFEKLFTVERIIAQRFTMTQGGRYASQEYLFFDLKK